MTEWEAESEGKVWGWIENVTPWLDPSPLAQDDNFFQDVLHVIPCGIHRASQKMMEVWCLGSRHDGAEEYSFCRFLNNFFLGMVRYDGHTHFPLYRFGFDAMKDCISPNDAFVVPAYLTDQLKAGATIWPKT